MRCTVGDLAQVRNRILADDPELAEHIRRRQAQAFLAVGGGREVEGHFAAACWKPAAPNFELELIMQRIGRPVFAVMGGQG